MLTKQKLEAYLSRCMQSAADFAEIFEQFEEYEMLETLDLKVEKASRKVTAGLGVRLYREVQSVYGYTNDSSEEAILALVDDLRAAIGEAEEGAEKKTVELTRVEYENRNPVRVDYREVSLEDKAELIFRAERAAKAQDERIVKTAGKLLNVREEVQISNSEGRLVSDVRVRTRMMMSAYASENGVFMEGGDRPGAGKGLEFFEEKTPEEIGKEAARQAIVMLSARDCPSGKMPVIIDNEFGGVIFHESCGHALEATGVAKNQSIFAGKKGQQIAAPCVSAVDDGTIPNAWGSQNVDDEGNFQEKRVLIKDGILQSYMVDRLNGRRMGEPSTGSGRRESYKFEPTSRMSNTFILAGTDSFESLFEGVERGLYAKKMGGGSVNPQTGEFNFAVEEGYLIENGKISYPVKGASLIGNGRDILMNIDKVSDNLARGQGMCGSMSGSIPTDVGQPSLRVSSITVGGTANE
ncbi:MAG: TldD/PmbA family protein [Lachnospiraceae bacterium]|nr:TldD/PmbA family protein [Lachnospiraceae bacterium]